MRRKMRFIFPDIDNELYGTHAKNMMKTDARDNGDSQDNTKINQTANFCSIVYGKMNPDMLFLMYGLMRDCS